MIGPHEEKRRRDRHRGPRHVHRHGRGRRGVSSTTILGTLETARQAQSLAFAAEFLAPAEWLRTQVGSAGSVDEEAVDDLAAQLDVSSWVVRYQIQNHHIAEISNPVWPSG